MIKPRIIDLVYGPHTNNSWNLRGACLERLSADKIRAPTTWQDLGSHNPTSNTPLPLKRHPTITPFSIIIGLACGYAYAKTRRLIPIMIGHWLGDTISLTTIYFI